MNILKPYAVIGLILCLSVFQCKNAEKSTDRGLIENTADYKKLAEKKLGNEAKYNFNQEGSMVLCQIESVLPKLAGIGVKFFVFDAKNNKVIYEGEIDKGTVHWHSNTQLSLFYTPGTMRTGQTRDDYTYIYDLDSKEKIRKNDLNLN